MDRDLGAASQDAQLGRNPRAQRRVLAGDDDARKLELWAGECKREGNGVIRVGADVGVEQDSSRHDSAWFIPNRRTSGPLPGDEAHSSPE